MAGTCQRSLKRRAGSLRRMTKWKRSDADEMFRMTFWPAANEATCGVATLGALGSVLTTIAIMVLGGGCQRPASPAIPSSTGTSGPATTGSAQPRLAPGALTGRELYPRHCSPCHGVDGDGQGVATRFLFPSLAISGPVSSAW